MHHFKTASFFGAIIGNTGASWLIGYLFENETLGLLNFLQYLFLAFIGYAIGVVFVEFGKNLINKYPTASIVFVGFVLIITTVEIGRIVDLVKVGELCLILSFGFVVTQKQAVKKAIKP